MDKQLKSISTSILTLVPLKGYEGRYSITKKGNIWSHLSNKYLTIQVSRKGYNQAMLYSNSTKKQFRLVHRLVAATYLTDSIIDKQINHKDGNKNNNDISNLEICTAYENINHAIRTNLIDRGDKYHTEDQIKYGNYGTEWVIKDISNMFDIDEDSVNISREFKST